MKSVRLAFFLSLALHALLLTANWTWTLPRRSSHPDAVPLQVTCGQPSAGHPSGGRAAQSIAPNSVSENPPAPAKELAKLPEPAPRATPEMKRPAPPPVDKIIQPVLPEKPTPRPVKTTSPETVKRKKQPRKPTEAKKPPQKKLQKTKAEKPPQKKPHKTNAHPADARRPQKKAAGKTVDTSGSPANSSITKTDTSAPGVPADSMDSVPAAGKGNKAGPSMGSTPQAGKKDGNGYRSALPLYDKNPPPRYPRRAKKRGVQGEVILEVAVSRNGTVSDCQVFRSSGHSVLDKAALKAVKRWVFQPATENGKPIDMTVNVPIRFELK